jgi:hypothetical protein
MRGYDFREGQVSYAREDLAFPRDTDSVLRSLGFELFNWLPGSSRKIERLFQPSPCLDQRGFCTMRALNRRKLEDQSSGSGSSMGVRTAACREAPYSMMPSRPKAV